MDHTQISALAKEISDGMFANSPWYWVTLIAVLALGFYFGPMIAAIGKGRGERAVTKDDFDALKHELELNTRLVEKIKTEIAHSDWLAREHSAIRRAKLEEIALTLLTVLDHVGGVESSYRQGLQYNQQSPTEKIRMLCMLYFPELAVIAQQLDVATAEYWVIYSIALSEVSTYPDHAEQVKKRVWAESLPKHQNVLELFAQLDEAVSKVMQEMLNQRSPKGAPA